MIEGNGWRLNSCSVSHMQPMLTCMGYLAEAQGKKFVHSDDAAVCNDVTALTAVADRRDGHEGRGQAAARDPFPYPHGSP
jgi:hypothetical protein